MNEDMPGQSTSSESSTSQTSKDLAQELRDLGTQLEQTFKTMVQSDQAKVIKENLTIGLQEIGKQVQAAVKSLQENPQVQQFAERGQQVVNQAQENPAFKDFQHTLVNGISQLNAKLAEFVDRMESQKPTTASTPQQVPVEDASSTPNEPATGDTTRLDM